MTLKEEQGRRAEVVVDAPPAPPDWDKFPFDVTCAECGKELRGQTEPRCPGCGIEFVWSDVVPIDRLTCGECGCHLFGIAEPRCPKCERAVDWNEVLARCLYEPPRFFQYRVHVPASDAPDWDKVPFDVGCARCGHDLRGQTEPRCPQCRLEFNWSEAVPIEHLTCALCRYHLYGLTSERCPECGSRVDWHEALARYHRSRLPYFEYRWRDRPFKSLIGTCRRAMSPRNLWGGFNLHDPPNVGALIVMVLIFLAASHIAIPAAFILIRAGLTIHSLVSPPPWVTVGPGFYADEFARFVAMAFETLVATNRCYSTVFVGVWLTASLASLLIFQQSMRQCKVRTAQVIRVWAYATPLTLPPILFLTFAIAGTLSWTTSLGYNRVEQLMAAGVVSAWVHVLWSLRCAYAKYLRMRHAAAVAFSSQLIALLTALSIVDLVLRLGVTAAIIQMFAEWFRIW